jgi:hypothetical protein
VTRADPGINPFLELGARETQISILRLAKCL